MERRRDHHGYQQVNKYLVLGSPSLSSLDELGPEFAGRQPEFAGRIPSGELEEEPSEEEPLNKNHSLAAKPRNPTWDTLVELFGEPTDKRRSLYGRVTKYLTDQEATPDLIRERATRIVTDWGPEKLTITSLETHWSRFDGLAGQISSTDVRTAKADAVRAETRAALNDIAEGR